MKFLPKKKGLDFLFLSLYIHVCNLTLTGKKIMKNKISLSIALALAMMSENKAMDQENQKKEDPVCLFRLPPAPYYSKLKTLHMCGFKLEAHSIKSLTENLPQGLTHLYLSDNQIKNKEAIALVAKPLPESLTYLDLPRKHIGAEGVRALAKHSPGLTHLDLSHNHIENEGIQASSKAST
jgi:hypothetical protein